MSWDDYRRWGHLQAALDPLGRLRPADLTLEDNPRARKIYCGAIGAEFMHLSGAKRRAWVAERMERDEEVDVAEVEARIARAEAFEQAIQATYVGSKRFSLEGSCALIPLLDEVLDVAASRGAETVLIGMSHRGRLNVMVHIVGTDPADLFSRFEDVDPKSVLGGGDVKYHLGATGLRGRMRIHLASNPSHLEAVYPVVLGRARAKQDRGMKVLPIVMHGDAAFAGQGIVAETLNLAGLAAYDVGGTVHVVVNNLIGFTTTPEFLHSTRYATDVAKRLEIPILHVNGFDAAAVSKVGAMAAEYRYEFGSDVVVDLIGYRRHGHSEVDDPTATQPVLYRKIEALARPEVTDEVREELRKAKERAAGMTALPALFEMPEYWSAYRGGRWSPDFEVDTAAKVGDLEFSMCEHVHPKVAKLFESRREMLAGRKPVDWGTAELCAFGTLARGGMRVRVSGQDVRRGTFNQRHAVLFDVETGEPRVAVEGLEIHDSPLSEAGVLAFEYGYSRDYPDALVVWEAQFGDFANGAQIVIDQFVAAGEDKWGLLSGLVMLLPHGYEGQGPEHSSARLERFLQLAAEDNLLIAVPTTASQYFHLLRRQALSSWRKPLVVFTPKSMLRHPGAASPVGDLEAGRFHAVLGDARRASRVVVAAGKIVHELREERKKLKEETTAIVSIERLYPFPEAELADALRAVEGAREVVWVQEEPANMGAFSFVHPKLEMLAGMPVRSIKRSASASPATGSAKAHALEQSALLSLAFSTGSTKMRGKE